MFVQDLAEQVARALMLRVAGEHRRPRLLDDFAQHHENDPLRHLLREPHFMDDADPGQCRDIIAEPAHGAADRRVVEVLVRLLGKHLIDHRRNRMPDRIADHGIPVRHDAAPIDSVATAGSAYRTPSRSNASISAGA